MPRRAKAVRRPHPRSEAERGSLRESIRIRFQSEEALFFATIDVTSLFRALSTPPERSAFQQEFPREFFGLFDFFTHESDEWPASTMHHFRVFRRPADEFLEMLASNPPKEPYDPADLSKLHFYPEQFQARALERGLWWEANGWPMTSRERGFLADNEKENLKTPWNNLITAGTGIAGEDRAADQDREDRHDPPEPAAVPGIYDIGTGWRGRFNSSV